MAHPGGTNEPLLPVTAAETVSSAPPAAAAPLRPRLLYGVPQQAADYDEEYDERAAQWFELFVDLILVVAWTNVTDALYDSEHGIVRSLFLFWLSVNLVQAAWLKYMEYQTRFIDESFVHTLQLFVFILGLAGMAIHVGDPEAATEFTVSMLMQKIPVIGMCASTAFFSKRARQHMTCKACILAVSASICAVVVYMQPRAYKPFVLCAWTLVIALEVPSTMYIRLLIVGVVGSHRAKMVPINIDHVVDRTNAFIMITLGESLLSSMLKYGSLPAEARTSKLYACMAFVLVISFSIGLLYYNIQPPRHESAFRRSAVRGLLVYYTTFTLAPAILLVSVGVKYCMHAAVAAEGQVTSAETWMLYVSIALVLHLIFWLRVGHYWGVEPQQSDPSVVKKVKYLWWAVFAAWPIVPLCIAAVAVKHIFVDPAWNLGVAAGAVVGLVLAETSLTTLLVSMESEPQPVSEAIEQQ